MRDGSASPRGVSAARRHQRLIASLLCAGWLSHTCAVAFPAHAAPNASSAHTSRWWKLTCRDALAPCVLVVRLRGVIDESRLKLLQEALRRRDTAQRSLGRTVALQVDIDSPGGKVFAALEIGRLLRREKAWARVGSGAACISACVFVLMGATACEVAADARIGLHSPSLGDRQRDTLVPAMSDQLVHYAEEMGVSRQIVEDMLAIPYSRMRFVTAAELARYGVAVRPESSSRN